MITRPLFTPFKIKNIIVPTRIARAATGERMADEEGRMPPGLAEYYANHARDKVGLIQPGYTFVAEAGRCSPGQLGIHTDAAAEAFRPMLDGIHKYGAVAVVQLVYNFARSLRMPVEELAGIRDAFAEAAARAKSVGFDGVSLHAAHGYLLSQFLSPFYNRRRDEYGGSVGNRARFPMEVLRAVRAKVGDDFFVMAKINTNDYLGEKGATEEMSIESCRILADAGLDMIETSGGMPRSIGQALYERPIESREDEAFFRDFAIRLKKAADIPLMLTGGIRSYEVAEEIVRDGIADLVGMARPLMAEPGLARRWFEGDRRAAACTNCNTRCRDAIRNGYCEIAAEAADNH